MVKGEGLIELAQWAIDQREYPLEAMDKLLEIADPKTLPIFKQLLSVNNSLVRLFWEICIYRERCGLTSIALPHK